MCLKLKDFLRISIDCSLAENFWILHAEYCWQWTTCFDLGAIVHVRVVGATYIEAVDWVFAWYQFDEESAVSMPLSSFSSSVECVVLAHMELHTGNQVNSRVLTPIHPSHHGHGPLDRDECSAKQSSENHEIDECSTVLSAVIDDANRMPYITYDTWYWEE